MNCELAHEQIVTAAYGELPDDLIHELDRHVTGCAECQKEREQVVALKVLADAHPVVEPDPNLVARARLRLDEALDALPPKRWYERLGERILNNFATLQARSGRGGAFAGRRGRRRPPGRLSSTRRTAPLTPHVRKPRRLLETQMQPAAPPRSPMWPASPALCASPTARSSTSATTRSCRARSRARSTTRPFASC